MSELKRSSPIAAVTLALGFLLASSATVRAADFQVAVKRFSVPQCTLTGSMLNIDPTSGNVSIDLSADFSCYPLVVSSIANGASLTVTGATTVGGGTTGAGTVNLLLTTGLSAITPGVTCVPDGYTASNVTVLSNTWTTNLCGPNCGATVPRSVDVQNTSATQPGSISFKAKCTYQDQSNPNLSTVRTITQPLNPAIVVQPGTAPPANFCQSVSELGNSKGLTPAMRQLSGKVTGGTMPGNNIPFLDYTSIFGVTANTYPAGSGDTSGFGFPGTNKTTISTTISRDKYISLQFRVPSLTVPWVGRDGEFFFQSQPGVVLSAAIAPCPGQFDTDPLFPFVGQICKGESELNAQWLITGQSTLFCQLVPGKTYYLNLIHAQRSTPTDSTCPGGSCSVQIINRNTY